MGITDWFAGMMRCSFCGKSHQEVKRLVAGPGVFICDGCIGRSNALLEAEKRVPDQIRELLTEQAV